MNRKTRQLKTPTEFLARLERDLWSWVALWGRPDADRLVAAELDAMFMRFGHACRIGDEEPRAALLRLQVEAERAGDIKRAQLTECLRAIGGSYESSGARPMNHAVQSGTHKQADRGLDSYATPRNATLALLRAERLPHGIWECATGEGGIANVLREAGHAVIASDVAPYEGLHFVRDFLECTEMPAGCEAIVTNPPYNRKILNDFVRHALDLCPHVLMLGKLQFLAGVGRSDILEHRGLARVHVFRDRIDMMHRANWTGPRATQAISHAWLCWDRNHRGPATFHRISFNEATPQRGPAESRPATRRN